jgi:hypothetical protein
LADVEIALKRALPRPASSFDRPRRTLVINRKTLAAAIIAVSALAATSANAGSLTIQIGGYGYNQHHGQHYKLSAHEVRWILRHRGYRNISFSDTHGSSYELTARRHGKYYYLVVSSWSGDILRRHRI